MTGVLPCEIVEIGKETNMKITNTNGMKLKDKAALVTGGAGGIGAGIVRRLVREGAVVMINHIAPEKEEAEKLLDEITAAGGKADLYEADVTDEAQVEAMVKKTIEVFGDLDILVNCAGITIDGTIRNISMETWNKVLSVNLNGPFLTMKHALTHMIPQKKGRVINISSLGGLIGNAGAAPYSASKAGVIGLTKAVAREVAKKNITVNAICPSVINTKMTAKTGKEAVDAFLATTPIPRMGEPEEVGGMVVYLASDDASFLTGGVFKFDGGMGM